MSTIAASTPIFSSLAEPLVSDIAVSSYAIETRSSSFAIVLTDSLISTSLIETGIIFAALRNRYIER